MRVINPNNNTERENYKILTGSIIPRPIAFVTTQSNEGIVNAAPFSFFSIVSSEPPMLSISIGRKNGELKDTARNILAKKEFVIHIVDEMNVQQVNETAASLPYNQSEIELANLQLIESSIIAVPGVKESKVRFECTLEQHIKLENNDLLIGKVVCFHIAEEVYEDGKINAKNLGAVSRLAGSNYAKLGESFSLERPK